jgi:hypothetical protein
MSFTDATKQKPEICPFCPAEPTPELVFDEVWKYGFKCENKDCLVQPSTGLYVTLAGALGAWNGRSYQVAPVGQPEPVLWMNTTSNGLKIGYGKKESAVEQSMFSHTVETAVPLYRGPVANKPKVMDREPFCWANFGLYNGAPCCWYYYTAEAARKCFEEESEQSSFDTFPKGRPEVAAVVPLYRDPKPEEARFPPAGWGRVLNSGQREFFYDKKFTPIGEIQMFPLYRPIPQDFAK